MVEVRETIQGRTLLTCSWDVRYRWSLILHGALSYVTRVARILHGSSSSRFLVTTVALSRSLPQASFTFVVRSEAPEAISLVPCCVHSLDQVMWTTIITSVTSHRKRTASLDFSKSAAATLPPLCAQDSRRRHRGRMV